MWGFSGGGGIESDWKGALVAVRADFLGGVTSFREGEYSTLKAPSGKPNITLVILQISIYFNPSSSLKCELRQQVTKEIKS